VAVAAGPAANRKVFVTSERDGVVSDIDPVAMKVRRSIHTGASPTALLLDAPQTRLFVANSGSDTVSIIDPGTDKVLSTVLLRPGAARGLPGCTPEGMAVDRAGKRLYVALADMNAVAVLDVGSSLPRVLGYIPVGWYPTSVRVTPDGKHLLLTGAAEGQPLRTYEMDLDEGKPQPMGPADFIGVAVSPDEKRIAGRHASGEAAVFDLETQKLQAVPGIEPSEALAKWTEDGNALLVYAAPPREAHIYRLDAATGMRTLLQTVEPRDKTGSMLPIRLAYAERTKTYVYSTVRVLGTLYVAEGLE